MANIVSILILASILGICVLIHIVWLKLLEPLGPLPAHGLDSTEADLSRNAVLICPNEAPQQPTDCSIWECVDLDIS